jgi:quercetin dioxygenase-like cupin family protein
MTERPMIDPAQAKVLSLAAETKYAEQGIVSRTLLRTANARVVLFGFDEAQELSEHTSTQHAMVQVLEGTCDFTVSGTTHQMKAGDVLYMPPQAPHACVATSRFSMLLTLFKP